MTETDNIDKRFDLVIDAFKNKGVKLNDTGVSEIDLREAENIVGFEFPDSFKQFFRKVNGFKDYDWTEHMISIWPIERIIEEYPFRNQPAFIPFADFLICSHCYGFLKNQPGIYKRYDLADASFEKIADNFVQAIDLISLNSDSLY